VCSLSGISCNAQGEVIAMCVGRRHELCHCTMMRAAAAFAALRAAYGRACVASHVRRASCRCC
jgi:hypothetical protein